VLRPTISFRGPVLDPQRVSVVIPCYNAERWIARAVESVHDQQYENIQTVVIDDGSSDWTPDILRSLPNIQWRRTPNQGGCRARNLGLEMATGDFVLFLDADDYLDPDSIREWLKSAGEADLVFGPFAHQLGRRRIAGKRDPEQDAISVARHWLNGRYVPTCAVLWRASFVRQIGGWSGDLLRNQDGELAMRGLLNGARVRFSSRGCGVYVHHEIDGVSKRSGRRVAASECSALDRLWSLAQARGHGSLRDAFAGAFYRLAYQCFATGIEDVGALALSRARELGLQGHLGSVSHQMLAGVVGLRTKLLMTGIVKGRRFMNHTIKT
jgi:hypothetical protein